MIYVYTLNKALYYRIVEIGTLNIWIFIFHVKHPKHLPTNILTYNKPNNFIWWIIQPINHSFVSSQIRKYLKFIFSWYQEKVNIRVIHLCTSFIINLFWSAYICYILRTYLRFNKVLSAIKCQKRIISINDWHLNEEVTLWQTNQSTIFGNTIVNL